MIFNWLSVRKSRTDECLNNILVIRAMELLVVRDNYDSFWELPVPTALLIGWRTAPESVDAGAPPEIASILARALCEQAVVSFLSEILRKQRKKSPFADTRDPAVAAELFDQGYFVWSMRGQIVLLSDPSQPVPASPRNLLKLRPPDMIGAAAAAGFSGILLPGVDGDVAGLWCFTADLEQRMLEALDRSCQAAGAKLDFVSSTELANRLASSLLA